jgi:Glycosyltransferase 61
MILLNNNSTTIIKESISVTHSLPAGMDKADATDFQTYTSYTTQPVLFKTISGAWLSPDGVAYQQYKLEHDTLTDSSQAGYYQYKHLLKKKLFAKKIELEVGEKYLLVTNLQAAGHFHWFCEVLPKLIVLEADFMKEVNLLLPDKTYIRKMGVESLKWLGLHFKQIVFLADDCFYKVPELLYINNVSLGGLNPVLMQGIQNKLTANQLAGTNKLYLSRKKAAFRKVLNEDDLLPLLQKYNVTTVYAEDLSPEEQAQLFGAAHTLIGIHGAGLANCIFMHPGSNLVELRKKEKNTSNVGYWHLASCLRHNYFYFNGTPDNDLPLVGRGCNLIIDPYQFEDRILKQLFCE